MKNYLFFFPIFFAFFLLSQPTLAEDTTRIVALDKIDLTWWGKQSKKVFFPTQGKSYRKIIMNYTLSCPSVGCNRFDYTTKVEAIVDEGGPNQKIFELGRVITPYGSGLNGSWKFNHEFDVTDYLPILKDSVSINAWFQGYPDDGKWWVLTVDFVLIEGTPARNPLQVDVVYNSGPNGFLYGNPTQTIETWLTPKSFTKHPNAAQAAFMLSASGHGFGNNASNGNPDNCAEFCAKNYFVKVYGNSRYFKKVWRDDCGLNPTFPQNGTWIYNRAGWCPGTYTDRDYHEITPFLQGNTIDVDVDWEAYTYTGGSGFPIHYIIEAHLFQFGANNFTVDAAIEDIISPTTKDIHGRSNPSCKNPAFVLKNNGSETLTRVDIIYGVKGATNTFTHRWQGSLPFNSSTVVTLPANGLVLANAPSNIFEIRLQNPNGKTDENVNNDVLSSRFTPVMAMPEKIMLWGTMNNAASENSIIITDDAGNVVYSKNNFTNGQAVRDTFDLSDGCYTLTLKDNNCDGLSFPFNSAGNGGLRLHRTDGTLQLLYTIPANFGCETALQFVVGKGYSGPNPQPTSISKLQGTAFQVSIYPNPAQSTVYVQVEGEVAPARYLLTDINGRILLQNEVFGAFGFECSLVSIPNGIYLLQLQMQDGNMVTKKLVVSH